jgi:glycosyltransferase involved in cell wall biosynthesis
MVCTSVIICTHNPRPHYLHRVLGALRIQTLPLEQWELLLIDNASNEPLTSNSWDISWHPHARLLREDKLGLALARLRGMQEAISDLLVFVDDDNVLERDYLSEAIRIKRDWPQLGVWGSAATVPEFEVEPAGDLRGFLGMLGLRHVSSPRWSNVMPSSALPFGAGQCVRMDVAIAYREHFERAPIAIIGRAGSKLFSGEDSEICYVACDIGLGVGIFPELKLTHLIPKERLSEDYLVKLGEGHGTSNDLLAYKWQKILPVSPFSGYLGLFRVLRNLLARKGVHRRMYLASLRSRLRARAVISETLSKSLKYAPGLGKRSS